MAKKKSCFHPAGGLPFKKDKDQPRSQGVILSSFPPLPQAREKPLGTSLDKSACVLGVKKVGLLTVWVFSLKSSTAGAFVIPFSVLSQKM